jgi:hypothetical protein
MHVFLFARSVVDEQHSASLAGEVLLEGENLSPVAKGVFRQQPQLRK